MPKVPLYALIATIVFVISAVLLLLYAPPSDERTTLVLGLIVTTIPSLVAAFASEKVSRDVRNGVLTQKVTEGAERALDNKGVTEVVNLSQRGETSVLAMQALAQLLERNTAANVANTSAVNREDKANGR